MNYKELKEEIKSSEGFSYTYSENPRKLNKEEVSLVKNKLEGLPKIELHNELEFLVVNVDIGEKDILDVILEYKDELIFIRKGKYPKR